jgi:hypothetical protein
MDLYSDSTDRSAGEYFLFALGFIGFLLAASGIVVGSPVVALIGGVIFLLVVAGFDSAEE